MEISLDRQIHPPYTPNHQKQCLINYFETQEFEDDSDCQRLIDEYDNDSFWERLIEELTMRDLQAEFAGKKTKDKDPDEYFARYAAIEKKYMKEFEKYGLENVTFKKGKPARTTN